MTTRRLSISIPPDLHDDVQEVKEKAGMNISRVCARALGEEVEKRRVYASSDLRRKAILRLRKQREEFMKPSPEEAHRRGFRWVMEDAAYEDIHRLFEQSVPVEGWLEDSGEIWSLVACKANYIEGGAEGEAAHDPDRELMERLATTLLSALPSNWREQFEEEVPADRTSRDETPEERAMRLAFLKGIREAWDEIWKEVER